MSEEKKPTDPEWELFRAEVGNAQRLHHDRVEPYRRKLKPLPLPPERSGEAQPDGDDLVDLNIETGDELLFVRPGIQKRLFQELRRGHLPPQASLDLHGLRVHEARTELARFLDFARRQRLRVVHVIHGKGFGSQTRQPVLKQKVNQWLRQRPEVLAFCSAPRFDGGLGAVYALISRKGR